MDRFDKALLRYGMGEFTDVDIVRCTGLTVRAWRELIRTRAVATITESQGRGHVRLCDQTVLKRAAAISALNRAGLSLAVSGHVAFALPSHTLLYEVCDPWMILFNRSPNSQDELPPRVKNPPAKWFNPNTSDEADPRSDWMVSIYDGRFVGLISDVRDPPTIFGELSHDSAAFLTWWPRRGRDQRMGCLIEGFCDRDPKLLGHVSDWESPARWSKELKSLGYRYERHDEDDDPLCLAANASIRSPILTTTVNVTLAIRRALRRYLEITPPTSEPK
jgi:hypothetical protein